MKERRGDERAVPTLGMVADRAGVSTATVSRVINNLDRVSPSTIAAVRAAVEELGYVPNRMARSLVQGRANSIGVVIPESTARVFADPFFATIMQGATDYLSGTEFTLSLVLGSDEHPEKVTRFFAGGNVDGAIVLSQRQDRSASAIVLSSRIPQVFAGRPLIDFGQPAHFVDVDNVAASRAAVEYLIRLGRTRIATITGAPGLPAAVDRLEGWRRALQANGLIDSLVAEGDFSPESGRVAAEKLLAGPAFDALFAANDQMAFAAQLAILGAGLRVPEDVAIVGFDDDSFSVSARPTLTTVRQPVFEMGRTMADVLVRVINGERVRRVTLLDTEFVRRQSA